MVKIKRIFLGLSVLLMTLSLSGCHLVMFLPKGIIARDERDLFITTLALMAIIVIPVILLIFIIAFKYRASNKKAKYTPDWAHNNWLEFAWWVVPILIIIALAVITIISTHKLDPYRPLDLKKDGLKGKPIVVQAVALRWKWLFIYPQLNIATVNWVEFPVNREVSFQITADAPMNSFQIPALGGQIYAMNGMRTKLHLMAYTKGTYNGRSVNISGYGFSDMTFKAKATSEADFKTWVAQVKKANKKLTMSEYYKLVLPSTKVPVSYYSSVKPDLFRDIIKQFLTPDMHKVDTNELGVHL